MPVRKRRQLRRAGEVEAWAGYMMSGFDYFDDLAAIGLIEATARSLAEEVWHDIGSEIVAKILADHAGHSPPSRPFWAEEMFGAPGASGKRRLGRR